MMYCQYYWYHGPTTKNLKLFPIGEEKLLCIIVLFNIIDLGPEAQRSADPQLSIRIATMCQLAGDFFFRKKTSEGFDG